MPGPKQTLRRDYSRARSKDPKKSKLGPKSKPKVPVLPPDFAADFPYGRPVSPVGPGPKQATRKPRTSDPNLEPGLAAATRRAQVSSGVASRIKKSEQLHRDAMKRRYAQMLRKRRGSGGASRQFPD